MTRLHGHVYTVLDVLAAQWLAHRTAEAMRGNCPEAASWARRGLWRLIAITAGAARPDREQRN